ncbi:hypothetical protein JCM6882_001662 [Rhodosporidiobolus microsporus]
MSTVTVTQTETRAPRRYPLTPSPSPPALFLHPSPPHSAAEPCSTSPPASRSVASPAAAAASPTSSSSHYTTSPPGALVFDQHVHRPPRPMKRSEQWKLAYMGNFAVVTLEPWESWLVHVFLLSLLALSALFLSRLFAPTSLLSAATRLKYYLVGVPSASSASHFVAAAAKRSSRSVVGWAAQNASMATGAQVGHHVGMVGLKAAVGASGRS